MKKYILFGGLLFAALSFTSCSGDYDDWANPQSNAQESAVSKYGVSFAAGSGANVVMPVEDDDVNLVAISSESSDVTGYSVKSVTVNGETIPATISGNNIVVSAYALDSIIEKQNNSRAAVSRTIEVKSSVSLNLASGDAVTTDVIGTTAATVTPAAVPSIDEKGYYLLGDFSENGGGWDITAPVWMTKVSDGVYTATVNTKSTGDNWFKFYAGSHHSSTSWDEVNLGQMGCRTNGDNALTGFIVFNGDQWAVQTPVISGQGTFEVTIDMNNLVYTVKRAEAMYYLVGNMQNTTWSGNLDCMFYALGGNKYNYTTKFAGAWDLKFWDSKGVNNWDTAWGTAVDGDGSASGSLINSGSKSFQAPSKGEYYTLTINMNTQTYSWTKLENQSPATYSNVSLIGDFNGWDGDVDLAQEKNAPHNWYVRAAIPKSGGLKFRANYDWAISWGTVKDAGSIGDVYYLATGTENITVPAGTYDFYLNDITGNFNIVPVK